MNRIRLPIAVSLFLCLSALLVAKERFRVVLQDVRPEFVNVSRQPRIVAARGYQSLHTFQVIDVENPSVLLVIDLPEQVRHAAAGPDNDWFVVSGEDTVYRVDRSTGEVNVLLSDISGAVALSADGNRLAVLGSLKIDPEEDRPARFFEPSNLGIYDLRARKWLARTPTPIMMGGLVYFDGDEVVAYGRGGRVHHRRASSFRCDVRLNVETGKSDLTRGLELFRSEAKSDEYNPPKQVTELLEARATATARLAKIQEKLNPAGARTAAARIFHPLPATDHPTMLVDRRHSNGFASGMLSIRRDGTVDITPVKIDGIHYVRLLDDRLVEAYDADRGGKVFDFLTKKQVMQLPPRDRSSQTKRFHRIFPTGCLLYEDGTLSWYRTAETSAVWRTNLNQTLQNMYPLCVSPDGRYLAVNHRDGENVFDIYSLATGKPIASIRRMDDIPAVYSFSPSFSQDGKRLGALVDGRFLLYEMPSGKRLRDEAVPHDKYHWRVTSVDDYWIIGSESSSSLFHEKTGWGPMIPLDNILRAAQIRCRRRESLLVETKRGLGAIVDLKSGEVQARWYVGEYQGGMGGPEFPPRAFTADDGKLLIRCVAHAAEIELIDLETLQSVAKVHPVPVNGELGWVISTPDGYWDASEGAEDLVTVYHGLRRLPTDAAGMRRNGPEIQKRIARLRKR